MVYKTRRWTSTPPASMWMASPYRRPAVTLIFQPQNLIRSSVWDNKYSLYVPSKLFKPFMRYHGNKICHDKLMWQMAHDHLDSIRMPHAKFGPDLLWLCIRNKGLADRFAFIYNKTNSAHSGLQRSDTPRT